MATFTWDKFNAGWIPSDDDRNGRKNGCLQMDNLVLDKNGVMQLAGGTLKRGSQYANQIHSIYPRNVGATKYIYVADTSGNIFRDNTNIGTGGSALIAAFAPAFDFTLVASGNKRIKDDGTTAKNLGITKPVNPGTVVLNTTFSKDTLVISPSSAFIVLNGGYATGGGFSIIQVDPVNFTFRFQSTETISPAKDLSSMLDPITGLYTKAEQASDIITFFFTADEFDLAAQPGVTMDSIDTIQIDILLVQPDGIGTVVTDYYSFTMHNGDSTGVNFVSSIQIGLAIRRDEFKRFGSGSQTWADCKGYRLTVVARKSFNIYLGQSLANPKIGFFLNFTGGSASWLKPFEQVQYRQVNVANNGQYIAKSSPGPIAFVNSESADFYTFARYVPQDNTGIDPQINEVWIYRKGFGNNSTGLARWYRVGVVVYSSGFANFVDTMNDQDVQTLGITLNENLVSINSAGISDTIIAIVGPIEGRWFFFTTYTMYPSDINDPDIVDVSIGVRIGGSNSEKVLWAHKVGEQTVLVGTTQDIYVLGGNFITLPDNTVDVYLRGLGCQFPPISYDATVHSGQVYYMASDGWRSIDTQGNNQYLVAPNIDRLYQNEVCYGYNPTAVQVAPGSVRFPCVIAKNKFFGCSTGNARIEVWDSIRSYWRVIKYGLGEITAICLAQDGRIYAAFDDRYIREIDYKSSNLIDGTTKQSVSILSPIFDDNSSRNRKDFFTLKLRCLTGGDSLTVKIILEDGTQITISNAVSTASILEVILDTLQTLIPIPHKTFQFLLTGNFNSFALNDISLDYNARPIQLTSLLLLASNLGNALKKRLRVQPFVIDTLGNNVTLTPRVDGANTTVSVHNSTEKLTQFHFFKVDIFGVDIGYLLTGGPFEFYEMLQPDIVQVLPIAKQFDQVGPIELFKYGKIKEIELRVLCIGGVGTKSTLPYTLYFSDGSNEPGTLEVQLGIEESYNFGVKKGTSGVIFRMELGPTSYNFHRYYVRIKVARSGKDTENEWVTVGGPEQ